MSGATPAQQDGRSIFFAAAKTSTLSIMATLMVSKTEGGIRHRKRHGSDFPDWALSELVPPGGRKMHANGGGGNIAEHRMPPPLTPQHGTTLRADRLNSCGFRVRFLPPPTPSEIGT